MYFWFDLHDRPQLWEPHYNSIVVSPIPAPTLTIIAGSVLLPIVTLDRSPVEDIFRTNPDPVTSLAIHWPQGERRSLGETLHGGFCKLTC